MWQCMCVCVCVCVFVCVCVCVCVYAFKISFLKVISEFFDNEICAVVTNYINASC